MKFNRRYILHVMVLVVPTFIVATITIFGIFSTEAGVGEKVVGIFPKWNLFRSDLALQISSQCQLFWELWPIWYRRALRWRLWVSWPWPIYILGNYLVASLCIGAAAVIISVSTDFVVHCVSWPILLKKSLFSFTVTMFCRVVEFTNVSLSSQLLSLRENRVWKMPIFLCPRRGKFCMIQTKTTFRPPSANTLETICYLLKVSLAQELEEITYKDEKKRGTFVRK